MLNLHRFANICMYIGAITHKFDFQGTFDEFRVVCVRDSKLRHGLGSKSEIPQRSRLVHCRIVIQHVNP